MFVLDRNDHEPLYIQIYEQIKRDITEGRLAKGEKLTSGRLLAENIGVSRNTVDLAYEKLVSEGLVVNRARRGYFVDDISQRTSVSRQEARPHMPAYDMRRFACCAGRFPIVKWRQYAAKAMTECIGEADAADGFGDTVLKTEISRFLYKYRKIKCRAEDIVILNGIESCLGVLFAVMSKTAGISVPDGNKTVCDIAELCGINIKNNGLSKGDCIYIEPFVQNDPMPIEVRRQTVHDAAEKGLYIIENDRGFLFSENCMQLPALRAFGENVIYLGSFADFVFPASGIAFMVLPPAIKAEFEKLIHCFSGADIITCRTLAHFMRDRNWELYLYRLAAEEREKLAIMRRACMETFGRADRVNTAEGSVIIEKTAAEDIKRRAEAADIFIETKEDCIILCVRGLKKANIEYAVRLLHECAVNN